MAAPIPTTEPASLIAGDTAKWLKTLEDYPASSGWSLAYTLISATAKYTFTASASGADHLVNVLASSTAGWAGGKYSWRASVSLGAEVYTVASGTIEIKPAFSGDTLDNRSFARTALDNIEAYLKNPVNLTAASYEIAGRKLDRIPVKDLFVLRDKYLREVASEDAAASASQGLPDKRRIYVRFAGE